MSPPILTLGSPSNPPQSPPKATAHLLPCRVHHNGSIEPIQPFWKPEKQAGTSPPSQPPVPPTNTPILNTDGSSTSYFRGRKLLSTPLPLPSGYRGVVAAAILPPSKDEDEQDLPEPEQEVIDLEDPNRGKPAQGKLDVQAEFDEVLVWGHEAAVGTDGADGGYVRGMEEWIGLAGAIHEYAKPGEN